LPDTIFFSSVRINDFKKWDFFVHSETKTFKLFFMEIRKDKAEFLDNLLQLFDGVRIVQKKDLEIKYAGDSYLLVQTEKHLKILEGDGMIGSNVLDEYYLEPLGLKVLNDMENLGYLAKHKIADAEYERMEEDDDDDEGEIFWPDLLLALTGHKVRDDN